MSDFNFVCAWFEKAARVARAGGRIDSATLWEDGLKELRSIKSERDELLNALKQMRDGLPSECSCHESYTSREKALGYRFKDPECLYCDMEDEIKLSNEVIAKAEVAGTPGQRKIEKAQSEVLKADTGERE